MSIPPTLHWSTAGPKITEKKILTIEAQRSSALGARIETRKAPKGWSMGRGCSLPTGGRVWGGGNEIL